MLAIILSVVKCSTFRLSVDTIMPCLRNFWAKTNTCGFRIVYNACAFLALASTANNEQYLGLIGNIWMLLEAYGA